MVFDTECRVDFVDFDAGWGLKNIQKMISEVIINIQLSSLLLTQCENHEFCVQKRGVLYQIHTQTREFLYQNRGFLYQKRGILYSKLAVASSLTWGYSTRWRQQARFSCVFYAFFMRFSRVFHAFFTRFSCVFHAFFIRFFPTKDDDLMLYSHRRCKRGDRWWITQRNEQYIRVRRSAKTPLQTSSFLIQVSSFEYTFPRF